MNPFNHNYNRWTYRWYVAGFDDEIYWDTVTFEWFENGVPSMEKIMKEIKEQHNLKEEDLINIKVAGLPQIQKIN